MFTWTAFVGVQKFFIHVFWRNMSWTLQPNSKSDALAFWARKLSVLLRKPKHNPKWPSHLEKWNRTQNRGQDMSKTRNLSICLAILTHLNFFDLDLRCQLLSLFKWRQLSLSCRCHSAVGNNYNPPCSKDTKDSKCITFYGK